ncbi:fibrinogen alpha chain [Amia ocellicauda]|uniref:fibrinogen alpha chain n=1 Tax=Amia ocellicauda TaxID=2972642 RepID=UPI0034646152
MTKQTYAVLRKSVVQSYVRTWEYVDLAGELQTRLLAMKIHTDTLSQKIKALRDTIQKQVASAYQTEVDIDMKIRACRGSCEQAVAYRVDVESYRRARGQLTQVEQSLKPGATPAASPPVLTMKTAAGGVPQHFYRFLPIPRPELGTLFEDVERQQLVLEKHIPQRRQGRAAQFPSRPGQRV